MDLMKGSTNFRALSRKYDEFRAPSAEITVGGTKLAALQAEPSTRRSWILSMS